MKKDLVLFLPTHPQSKLIKHLFPVYQHQFVGVAGSVAESGLVASPLLVLGKAHHHFVSLHPLMYKQEQSLNLRDKQQWTSKFIPSLLVLLNVHGQLDTRVHLQHMYTQTDWQDTHWTKSTEQISCWIYSYSQWMSQHHNTWDCSCWTWDHYHRNSPGHSDQSLR